MTDTNAARQAKFKAQLREKGLRQIAVWVSDEQAAAIKAYLAGDAAALAPAAPSAKRRQGAPSSGRLMAPAGSALPTSKPNESGATDAATTPRFAGDAAKLADAPPPPIVVANDCSYRLNSAQFEGGVPV